MQVAVDTGACTRCRGWDDAECCICNGQCKQAGAAAYSAPWRGKVVGSKRYVWPPNNDCWCPWQCVRLRNVMQGGMQCTGLDWVHPCQSSVLHRTAPCHMWHTVVHGSHARAGLPSTTAGPVCLPDGLWESLEGICLVLSEGGSASLVPRQWL